MKQPTSAPEAGPKGSFDSERVAKVLTWIGLLLFVVGVVFFASLLYHQYVR